MVSQANEPCFSEGALPLSNELVKEGATESEREQESSGVEAPE